MSKVFNIGGGVHYNADSINLDYSKVIKFTPSVGKAHTDWGISNYYVKVDGVVYISLGIEGLTANQGNFILTLPVGYRPTSVVSLQVSNGGVGEGNCKVDVWKDGKVEISPRAGTYCSGVISFPVFD